MDGELTSRLGSGCLSASSLNTAPGNEAFAVKRDDYRNSVLRLNRHFDALEAWDEDMIAARGKALGALLCRVWPRPAESTA